MEDNFISADGRSFVGPQAVATFRAAALRSYLSLYEKSGIIPTRGFGLKRMMVLASEITGKKFSVSRKQIPAALDALDLPIEASKAALQRTECLTRQ